MKKYFIAALAMVGLSTSAFAIDYEPEEGLTVQVVAGMAASSINGMDDYNGKVGMTAGIKFEYMLPSAMGTYVNAGGNWTMKGAKRTFDMNIPTYGQITNTHKFATNYLEIPVHVGYRYNFSDELGIYGEFGPYFAFGFAGQAKNQLDADGTWTKDYEDSYAVFAASKKRPNFQIWDMGVGFRIGAEYDNHYSINLGCDWGITDMWRDSYRDAMYDTFMDPQSPLFDKNYTLNKLHNFNFTLTLGYRF